MLATCSLIVSTVLLGVDTPVGPVGPSMMPVGRPVRWAFAKGGHGFRPIADCSLTLSRDGLVVRTTGVDPRFRSPRIDPPLAGPVRVRLRLRTRTQRHLQLFWASVREPRWRPKQSAATRLVADGHWHTYELLLDTAERIVALRIDPGSGTGQVTISWLELQPVRPAPLELVQLRSERGVIRCTLRNVTDKPITACVGEHSVSIPRGKTGSLAVSVPVKGYLTPYHLRVRAEGKVVLQRHVFVLNPGVDTSWLEVARGASVVRFAPTDGVIELRHGNRTVALIAPLAHRRGRPLRVSVHPAEHGWRLSGELTGMLQLLRPGELEVQLRGGEPFEGPVVRPLGTVEQALLAGVEYLGRGERSSSRLDIEGPEHLRYRPDVHDITWPLAVVCTNVGSTAVLWQRPQTTQPIFSVPNVLDGPRGHRIGLETTQLRATVRFGEPARLERLILWAVRRHGLPALPPKRSLADHRALCLKAFHGPLWDGQGWGHCAEPRWPRQPYADLASSVYWLQGKPPVLSRLVPGGGHLADPTIYFVTGRAREWLRHVRARGAAALKRQRADGSFRYSGPMARGHFEDTASGYCARFAVNLLEAAYYTGDRRTLRAGLRALEYMKRFRTPRGAQTWEVPLHTPDTLASALLVKAYVLGYELSGDEQYRELAVRWALTGLPFVYLWTDRPIMAYATIAVFGATRWKQPVWIGRPVQWCGLVYADAVRMLAAHDRTVNWLKLAEGILRCAEQMQYTDGPYVGCLPDSLIVATQERFGPSINPSAIVALRRRLAGEPDGAYVIRTRFGPVVAPFPMERAGEGRIVVRSLAGVGYEVILPGGETKRISGTGADVVTLGQ